MGPGTQDSHALIEDSLAHRIETTAQGFKKKKIFGWDGVGDRNEFSRINPMFRHANVFSVPSVNVVPNSFNLLTILV